VVVWHFRWWSRVENREAFVPNPKAMDVGNEGGGSKKLPLVLVLVLDLGGDFSGLGRL
jgi:hypothetical protein